MTQVLTHGKGNKQALDRAKDVEKKYGVKCE